MSRFHYAYLALFAVSLPFGCSAEPSGADGPASGGTTSGGTTTSGGAAPSGGSPMAGGGPGVGGAAASGGASSGGSAASGGDKATGGATVSGGAAASGGADNSGTGGSASAVNASPGCGKGGRPSGGTVYKPGQSGPGGGSWLVFPEKYDGNTPLPVLIGFHGCGSGNAGDDKRTEFTDVIGGSGFATDYVLAAPVATSASCYDYGTDMPKAKALFTELIENYCVDLNRVFGAGHSYGAGGMLQTLTGADRKADFDHFKMKGIAPVAGWRIGNQSTVVATMYTQGIMDSERDGGDGADVVAKIVETNECAETTTPYAVDACNSGGQPVDAGCKLYSGCAAETIWCRHNDPNYSGTYHGIPCFWKQAAFDFFAGL
jgi:polyhydroxybutyrate depolymerase